MTKIHEYLSKYIGPFEKINAFMLVVSIASLILSEYTGFSTLRVVGLVIIGIMMVYGLIGLPMYISRKRQLLREGDITGHYSTDILIPGKTKYLWDMPSRHITLENIRRVYLASLCNTTICAIASMVFIAGGLITAQYIAIALLAISMIIFATTISTIRYMERVEEYNSMQNVWDHTIWTIFLLIVPISILINVIMM